MKIALCYNDLILGYLAEEEGRYAFYADSKAFKQAKKDSVLIFPISINEAGVEFYDNIPYPFSSFISATEREDLVKQAKIKPTDTLFEKLYKLAGLDAEHSLFYMKQDQR